ncbi:MAG: hypothetical protein GY807_15320 [Gammaproteobacteria bacterium]|nr:hypothetical protein [Gammaproteobacteria bacterium]
MVESINLQHGRHPSVSDNAVNNLVVEGEAILDVAQDQDWESVNQQATHWQANLTGFFESGRAESLSIGDRLALGDLQNINDQLIEVVKEARDSIAMQLKEFKRGSSAVRIYEECHFEMEQGR